MYIEIQDGFVLNFCATYEYDQIQFLLFLHLLRRKLLKTTEHKIKNLVLYPI